MKVSPRTEPARAVDRGSSLDSALLSAPDQRPPGKRSGYRRPPVVQCCLLACCVALSSGALHAQREEPRPGDQGGPLAISIKAAESILSASRTKNLSEISEEYPPAYIEKIVKGLEWYLERKKFDVQSGKLTEGSCRIADPAEGEDWFAVRAPGRSTSLAQLVVGAGEVYVVKMLSVEPVFVVNGFFLTAYVAEVEESWGDNSDGSAVGQVLRFYRREYDVTLAGERLCSKREELRFPKAGEIWLLLTATKPNGKGDVGVNNFFPIDEAVVQYQPYAFLNEDGGRDLDSLRLHFLAAQKK